MDSTNPATNTLLESYEEHSQSEVDGMLGDALSAFGEWKQDRLYFGSVCLPQPSTYCVRTLRNTQE